MKYKAIIFDMDGTITNTEKIWKAATEHILQKYLPNASKEELDALKVHFKGLALHETCRIINEATDKDCKITPEEIIKEKAAHAHMLYKNGVEYIIHFPEFHAKASKEFGLKTAIATNAIGETLVATMESLPLADFFGEHMYHIELVNKVCKPAPDIYLYAAKQLGVNPTLCIAIEDSAHGIAAAKAAGMYCIGINTGKDRHTLKQADEIVDCYREIDLHNILKKK